MSADEVLFLMLLVVACSTPFVMWWTKKPKGGWKVSNRMMGHCFTTGKVVVPGHPFKAPVLKKPKKK